MTRPSKNGTGHPKDGSIDWQATLTEHGRWLRTVAYSRLRDHDAVDEVMQEVALAAVRQAAPLRDVHKTAPWLYRLVVRQILLYRRRRGRQRKLADNYGAVPHPERTETSPLGWLLAAERRQQVRDALDRLPQRDAQMLLLKYTENWSYDQIARHLGVSKSAVESRLHRARKRLRAELTMPAESKPAVSKRHEPKPAE